jgi:hypothetical protein
LTIHWYSEERVASVSQYKGVRYRKRNKKWFAEIAIAGEYIWLGFCDSEIDAARTYDRAAAEQSGEFANLNFPEEWPPEKREEVHANHQVAGDKGDGKDGPTGSGDSQKTTARREEEHAQGTISEPAQVSQECARS